MLLLVGLGNPGEKYRRHRHNVGFMAIDSIADAQGFGPPRTKFHGRLREGELGGVKCLALKPQTFMNESGQSVGAAMRYYKLSPPDIIVFHDELDLAAGKLKIKKGGGNAGHNGLKSIDEHIGNDFRRVRIGIGHPGDKTRVTSHVLGDFDKADHDWLDPLLAAIAKSAKFLNDGDARFATAVAQELATMKETREAKTDMPAIQSRPAPKAPAPNAMTEALRNLFRNKSGKE